MILATDCLIVAVFHYFRSAITPMFSN